MLQFYWGKCAGVVAQVQHTKCTQKAMLWEFPSTGIYYANVYKIENLLNGLSLTVVGEAVEAKTYEGSNEQKW